jgi:predicted MFS family arabinose efflux permease
MPATTLFILFVVYSINFMDRQILAILAQAIKQDLDLSDTQVGLLYGLAFALVFAVSGIPLARYADRGNRVRVINWCLVVFAAMTAACGLATAYWHLVLARFGVAVGESGTGPPSHAIIADLYPVEKRSTAMAFFAIGPSIGMLLAFSLGGWVGQAWGWRTAFVVTGLVGLVVAVPCFVLLREPRTQPRLAPPRPLGASLSALFASRSLRHVFAGATIFSAAVFSIVGWLPSLLVRSGYSVGEAGTTLALVFGVGGAAGTLLGGALADGLGRRDAAWRLRVVALVLVLMAPAFAVAFLAGGSTAMVVLVAVPAALLGFNLGPTFAMVQTLAPVESRTTAAAALLFLGNTVGLGLGPVLIGALSDALAPAAGHDSLRFALLAVVPLCVIAAWQYAMAAVRVGDDLIRAETGTTTASIVPDATRV